MTKQSDTSTMNASFPHQEFSELLPFYVNGTLGDAERAALDEHLRGCLTCRAELAGEQRLMQAFRSSDAEQQVADDGFERVMARVRGSAAQPPSAWRRWGRRSVQHAVRRVAMVAMLAGVMFGIAHMQGRVGLVEQSFHTLSQDRGSVVGADVLYVAFDAQASMAAIKDALATVKGDVVSGPNRDNVFTVRVPASEVATAVDTLKARSGVKFAAPAAPGAAP
ncbi:MAG: zf-HC2 domain-containing protein [Gammaproteobacteria bacterium]|nr:zf-HC2 domain-containing protein [Gammaproteobacteria bacterium]